VLREAQLAELPGPPDRWIINVRVSKMGGLLRSLDVVRRARAAGFGIIVGAQVGETSVLTRAALSVAASTGSSLVAQEGAFGTHLLQHDVCDPPVMFGPAGQLDGSAFVGAPGFGLAIADRAANPQT
jgi:L-alanine-DL-glutamate epimerase-like enolase superfamily enzyme